MYLFKNWIFMIEIILAELILLYSAPKRKYFYIKLIATSVLLVVLSGFYPELKSEFISSQWIRFFKYTILFAFSIAGMGVCFDIKIISLLSATTSGYALQHLSYRLVIMMYAIPVVTQTFNREYIWVLECILLPFFYLIGWLIFGRMAAKDEFYKNSNPKLIVISFVTLFVCLIINRLTNVINENGLVNLGNCLYGIVCCALLLFINNNLYTINVMCSKNETIARITYEEKKQFEASKINYEQMNLKHHDLKYVLSLMDSEEHKKELEEYRKIIENYDNEIISGNETLDIILNEKLELCKKENISFTFLGKGDLLSFVDQYDLYSLFGNIIDNAIEALRKVEIKTKKIISLTIESKANFVIISAMNYFNGELKKEDSHLITTKTDSPYSHGFGVQSIKHISQKYKGKVYITAENNIFTIEVFLTLPHE